MPITFKSGRGGIRPGSGRKSTWQHRETTLVRVPTAIVNELMEVAHKLDKEKALENEAKSKVEENEGQLELLSVGTVVTTLVYQLNQSTLAKRLAVDHTTVRKFRLKKTEQDFAQWSRAKDPDSIAWRYDQMSKLYKPID